MKFFAKNREKEAYVMQNTADKNQLKNRTDENGEMRPKTIEEVYREYCARGRGDRAYTTIRKQDSLWNNHICARFGRRAINGVSAAEVSDYLTELYYTDHYSYRYIESFLKFFYLIFGQAYSRDYLTVETYSKLCLNKGTKIHMSKRKTDEDLSIVIFSREELAVLDEYFRGTNGETI